jgi:hypothetical protein
VPELATERGSVHVVDERPLAVDLDDREPLAVARFELRVAPDVDFLQLEPELVMRGRDRLARPLAEMAAVGVVEDDSSGSSVSSRVQRVDRSVQTAMQAEPARPDGRRRKRTP